MKGFFAKMESALEEKETQSMELYGKEAYEELFAEDYEGMERKKEGREDVAASFLEFDARRAYEELFAEDYAGDGEPGEDFAQEEEADLKQNLEPNSKIEKDGNTYETDDNGVIYKINGRELIPNTTFTIGGITYQTDEQGRVISCDGSPRQTPDGKRDTRAQRDAGGEDREEGDQGSHILARILGGTEGIENILPIRGPINQGPYHEMENEINKALKEGKKVTIHVKIDYENDSKRPSKITVTYMIDGKKTTVEFDNKEGSTALLESIADQVEKEQYEDLKQEIEDAKKDGRNISILAVKKEYDENGRVTKITVILRDEDSGTNEKRVLFPKEDGK